MEQIAEMLPVMRKRARFLCRFDRDGYDMAEDVASIAMEKMLLNCNRLTPEALAPTAMSYVKYAFLSRRSRSDDAKRSVEDFEEQYEVADEAYTADPTDKVFLAQILERINGLDRDLRNVMLMHLYGFTANHIAITRDTTPEAVMDLLYLARKEIGVTTWEGQLSGLLAA